MKRFNKLHLIVKWFIAISCVTILLILSNWWIEIVSNAKIWMLLIFIMVPVIQFLITPICTLLNIYQYYSPMVLVVGNNKRILDLHNGTSFDYLLEMSKTKPGTKWKKKMLYFYLSALYKIIQQVEDNKIADSIVIRGSSYFLSKRSADKLVFTSNRTSFVEKLNIVLNYFDLVWMYSLSNGKLTFPNLANIHTVRITGAELLKKKEVIVNLLNRLNTNKLNN